MTEDLIRLDSTSDIDDFDPLKSDTGILTHSSFIETNKFDFSSSNNCAPLSLTNPLYTFYEPQGLKQNGNVPNTVQQKFINRDNSRNDQDLLQEYGLNFNNFNSSFANGQNTSFDPFEPCNSTAKVNSKSEWTKFE